MVINGLITNAKTTALFSGCLAAIAVIYLARGFDGMSNDSAALTQYHPL